MKLNKRTTALIVKLESIIGSECYNPHSYDGCTEESGCSFRYPVTLPVLLPNGNEGEVKFRREIKGATPDNILRAHYKVGANHLFIGLGISKLLKFLEERYELDFNELERIQLEKNKVKNGESDNG